MSDSLDLPGVPPSLAFELRRAAQEAGVTRLALVGGVVRDMLLHRLHGVPWVGVPDLDWVVEGDAFALTEALMQRCGSQRITDVQHFGAYGTVALRFDGIPIDLASARREIYPVPAQNPEVKLGTLEQDLLRRDFTINAMAIDLMAEQLVDSHSGQRGLTNKQLTLLHERSIIDDPTRVIRAARYAARLGFTLDEKTEAQITQTISAWPWAWSTSVSAVAAPPALSTRLRMELDRLFQQEPWVKAISCLHQWNALSLIDPSLQEDHLMMRRLHWAQRLNLPLLPALVSGATDPLSVAQRLQLPGHQQHWLSQMVDLKQWLLVDAPSVSSLPSVWSEALEALGPKAESVALLICLMPVQWKPLLRWWGRWRKIKSLKTARQLLDSGWHPGPALGKELNRLRREAQDRSR